MIAEHHYITAADIAQAWDVANAAEARAAAAWDRVELATVEAVALEDRAATLREYAQRTRFQLGFRRAS